MNCRTFIAGTIAALICTAAHAQWDPHNGEWLKSDTTDLRVMTWNVQDGICSSNDKGDTFGDWNGIVRIIASLQPDVLILQECADNSGNGTGSGIDSISTLENVADLLVHGGTDIYNGNVAVGSYVQLFTGTGYDLPHVYVSEANDGFNRNMILSRYPFADLNGGGATFSTFALVPDAYQTGGTAGIRGYQFAEIDLPDEMYAGDIVVGNGHLKAGGSSSDFSQRELASRNIAYFIDYYYNGAGTGVSDPNNRISVPNTGTILDENTPVVVGGDLNQQPGNGPSEFIARAEFTGGTDGTDRDRSDSALDIALHPISNESSTQGGSSKLDYLIYQDSIATARRRFIFRSTGSGMSIDDIPEPARSFPVNPFSISGLSSDHRPVLIDFILPEAVIDSCPADFTGEGDLNFLDVSAFLTAFGKMEAPADFTGEGQFNFLDVSAFLTQFGKGCP
jgi:endonuclease/exonuclease/phosphatase family metal-dependent hydrolase